MNILVTGDSGFIGDNLCKRLVSDGHTVIGLDTKKKSIVTDNYYHFTIDINNTGILNSNIENTFDIHKIYNLASPTIPKECMENPDATYKTNTTGLTNILEMAKKCKVPASVVQISTIRIFEPIVESNSKLSCYIKGKKQSESICIDYIIKNNMSIKIARLFSVYGPGMNIDDSRVIPVFIKKALKNENIEIWGTGEQQDSFTYIDDIIDDLINLKDPITELGGDTWISIKDLAQKIIKLSNSKSKVVLIDKPGTVDRKNLQKNYKSRTSLDEGLLKTIKYYRNLVQRSSF